MAFHYQNLYRFSGIPYCDKQSHLCCCLYKPRLRPFAQARPSLRPPICMMSNSRVIYDCSRDRVQHNHALFDHLLSAVECRISNRQYNIVYDCLRTQGQIRKQGSTKGAYVPQIQLESIKIDSRQKTSAYNPGDHVYKTNERGKDGRQTNNVYTICCICVEDGVVLYDLKDANGITVYKKVPEKDIKVMISC